MTDEIHWKAVQNVRMTKLLDDMSLFAIKWHTDKLCDCMKNYSKEITRNNFVPCKHLSEAQWNHFNKKIKKIEKGFKQYWTSKLQIALTAKANYSGEVSS